MTDLFWGLDIKLSGIPLLEHQFHPAPGVAGDRVQHSLKLWPCGQRKRMGRKNSLGILTLYSLGPECSLSMPAQF